jgi:hypothetical protein
MGSVDRHAVDSESTPIFASMCKQLGMYGRFTATGDTDEGRRHETSDPSANGLAERGGECHDGGYGGCDRRYGSIEAGAVDEQASRGS